jgi:hypothetical protein
MSYSWFAVGRALSAVARVRLFDVWVDYNFVLALREPLRATPNA